MTLQMAKVIGHRGACGHAPENTLISMTKARELGANWVEFDVMLAKNGELIVIHDLTLDRTTNGSGWVADIDLDTLLSLDCGSWFSPDFAGQKIPTFCELLRHVSHLNLSINVEIKPHPGLDRETTLKTLELLALHWPSDRPKPLLSSFSREVIKTAYQSNHDAYLGYITSTWTKDWENILNKYNCISLHIDHKALNENHVKSIKNAGKLVLAYTVNDSKRANELFDWGVDAVFSDYPDLILAGISKQNRITQFAQ